MRNRDLRSIIGFILLAVAIFTFQGDHASLLGLAVSATLVIAFWYLNGLNFAISSLRNMLLLAAFFGVILLGAQMLFPTVEDSAKMGQLEGSDLNPAIIARLKESHEIALQLYLDHKPTNEERYFKIAPLPFTQDGFHYVRTKENLDRTLVPKTDEWVNTHLTTGALGSDVHQIETWFRHSFSYTLTPGALRSPHPLDEFLFQSEKGFCEHYAASLATLLKLRGYSAQVVVGYAGGSWNPLLRRLTYLESDAHAWVEVADQATHEWRIIDPTEWVMTDAVPGSRSDWSLVGAMFAILFLIGAFVYFVIGRADGLEALLKKINRLEDKHQLDATGLTISERVLRLSALYPDRARRMQETLSVYLASYFQSEPTKTSRRRLVRSLSKW